MFIRDQEATKAFRLSTEGTSVEIVGPRWSGRTEILRHVDQAYKRAGLAVLFVRGTGERLPIEAIRVALPALAGGSRISGSPASLVERISSLNLSVIMIDDADQLDDASWAVIETAHKALGVTVIAAALKRPLTMADNTLVRFAHPVVRIPLQPLGLEVVHSMLEDRLGGPVAPSLSGRIHMKSAGIPGFVIAITDAAAAEGLIRLRGTVWVDEPDLWSADLNGAYEALLHSYTVPVREAVETLALVGTVDLATARALIGQPLIETLEEDAFLSTFSTQREIFAAISPPGLGDYFRRQPSSARRLRLIETISDALAAHAPGDTDSVRLFLRTLPAPGDPGARGIQESPLIARQFTETYAIELAAATHNWTTTRSVESANRALSYYLTGPRDADTIDQVLRETSIDRADQREELTFRYLRSRWAIANEEPLEEIIETLLSDTGDHFEYKVALDALSCAITMEVDHIPSDYRTRLGAGAVVAGINGDITRLVLAYGHILSSRAAEAIPLLERRPSDAERELNAQYDVAFGLALYASGQLNQAVEWASAHIESCTAEIERMPLAGHAYVSLLALASLGRFDEAIDSVQVLLSASVSGTSLLFSPDRPTLFLLAAIALRMGRNAAAEGMLERADMVGGSTEALPLGHLGFIDAAATSADGNRTKAASLYLKVADDLMDRNYVLAADGAKMLSLIADFDDDLASAFRPRAEVIGGPLYAAYIDGRVAAASDDPRGLTEAAHVLRSEQAGDEALRFYTQAIKLYRDDGETEKADSLRTEVRELMADAYSPTSGVTARSVASFGLSNREVELVQIVATGLGNIEIARELGISVRTVETHIRNIKKKTGVAERHDMAALGAKPPSRG